MEGCVGGTKENLTNFLEIETKKIGGRNVP
jgi:hypothetical protein